MTVPQDGTVDVAFAVVCVAAERIAISTGGIVVIRADGRDTPHGITSESAPASRLSS